MSYSLADVAPQARRCKQSISAEGCVLARETNKGLVAQCLHAISARSLVSHMKSQGFFAESCKGLISDHIYVQTYFNHP